MDEKLKLKPDNTSSVRVAQVIGRVTHNVQDPSFKGGRWLVCSPLDTGQFNAACDKQPPLSQQFSLVTYDNLGAGEGDIVGHCRGRRGHRAV